MNTVNKNKEELILYAFIIGIFFFIFIGLNGNDNSDSQNSFEQKYVITELSQVIQSAPVITLPEVPDFNIQWTISDSGSLKQKLNIESSDLITNRKINTKHKLCTETYLNIKPTCLKVTYSFLYSSNEYKESPANA